MKKNLQKPDALAAESFLKREEEKYGHKYIIKVLS